jgi:hypothetical protein
VGSPPGLPGGGITGVLPTSGVGARIVGSTPAGGHNTPSDLASLSLSGSVCAAADPEEAMPWEVDRVGAQFAGAGAVAEGVAGACAPAKPGAAISAHDNKKSRGFNFML